MLSPFHVRPGGKDTLNSQVLLESNGSLIFFMSDPATKTPSSLSYLWKFAKPYLGLTIITILFLLLGAAADTLQPVGLKWVIDGVSGNKSLHLIELAVASYFGFTLASALASFFRDYFFASAEMGFSRSLSRALFTHLLHLQTSYHIDQKLGGTAQKLTRGARAITFIIDFMVSNILPTILQLILTTILLLRLYKSPLYGLITLATIVLYTWFTVWATEKRQKFRLASIAADDEVSGLEIDSLANIETVKYFNNEPLQLKAYEPIIEKRYKLSVISNQLFAVVGSGQALILLLGLGSLLILAVNQALAHVLTVGDLVLLTTYVARLAGPISTLAFVYRGIKDGIADLQGMVGILETDIEVPEPKNPLRPKKAKGDVRFDHVSFDYGNGRAVLKDINLEVTPGKRIAFVGPSGAGKSTIVKLLFRLSDPTEGNIQIDGIDLRELAKETRAELFAIVPQEPILFNATIAENIRFGKPDATQAEIEKAAELASVRELIESLPEKYETVVGERGVKLSGGEKQRVAIARAVIRDPKVLVFDEATSSLDSSSEQQILRALHTVSAGRTTIAVAHRLSTIADSDAIYVLEHGKIVESGTHQELLKKAGVYKKLWDIQAKKGSALKTLPAETA